MATTEAPAITLTPPDPVPVVAPAQAAGLVPLAAEQKASWTKRSTVSSPT
jgi:hypothetical protein